MNRTVALTFFLLRGFYFSIANNPVWFVLAPFVLFYFLIGLMGRHELVLVMLFVAGTHRFMRTFRAQPWTKAINPVQAAMRLLPVDDKGCRQAVMAAVATYCLVMGAMLSVGVVLMKSEPPWLKPPEEMHRVLVTGDTLTILEGPVMDKSGTHDVPVMHTFTRPVSFVFDSLKRLPAWPLWVLAVFVMFSLFDAYLHYADRSAGAVGKLMAGMAHGAAALQGMCIAALMIDRMLPMMMQFGLRVSSQGTRTLMVGAIGLLVCVSMAWRLYARRNTEGEAFG